MPFELSSPDAREFDDAGDENDGKDGNEFEINLSSCLGDPHLLEGKSTLTIEEVESD